MSESAKAEEKKPKTKKAAKAKKEKKTPKPKLVANTAAPGRLGHNSGEPIPALVDLIDESLRIDDEKKALGKADRDIRNTAKTQFGILAWNWNYEKSMRKVDRDVRIQRESGIIDLKNMLGYQISLDLQPGTVARTEEELADPSADKNDEVNRRS